MAEKFHLPPPFGHGFVECLPERLGVKGGFHLAPMARAYGEKNLRLPAVHEDGRVAARTPLEPPFEGELELMGERLVLSTQEQPVVAPQDPHR